MKRYEVVFRESGSLTVEAKGWTLSDGWFVFFSEGGEDSTTVCADVVKYIRPAQEPQYFVIGAGSSTGVSSAP